MRLDGPEPEELVAWLMAGECPLDALQECVGWMEQMWTEQGLPIDGQVMVSAAGVARLVSFKLPDLKAQWEELEGRDVRFPLAPVVKAWQERPQLVEPERPRQGASFPPPLPVGITGCPS